MPPKLIEQLKVGGRLCIPVGSERGIQYLLLIVKQADGTVKRQALEAVRFVPMTGEAEDH